MPDITKIREWTDNEPEGDYDYPPPDVNIESLVTGELRTRILDRLGREDTGQRVTLLESEVETGWSEFTPETTCEIHVQVDDEEAWNRALDYSTENAMSRFLRWIDGDQYA